VDDGLSKAFYFNDPVLSAAKAKAASDQSAKELAALDAQLVSIQNQLAAARTTADKQKLEVEQQRQQALQAAKRLEAESLAAEAQREAAASEVAYREQLNRKQELAADQNQQAALAALATSRRAELDKLAAQSAQDDPDKMVETIERLRKALADIRAQYASALAKSTAAVQASAQKQKVSLQSLKPTMFETDQEFRDSIVRKSNLLEQDTVDQLEALRVANQRQLGDQTNSLEAQLQANLARLNSSTWTIRGSKAKLEIGEFDRNGRKWALKLRAEESGMPAQTFDLTIDFNRSSDPKAAILAMDSAVKAKALTGELDWGITYDASKNRYYVVAKQARAIEVVSASIVSQSDLTARRIAYFDGSGRARSLRAVPDIQAKLSAYDQRLAALQLQLQTETARPKIHANPIEAIVAFTVATYGAPLLGPLLLASAAASYQKYQAATNATDAQAAREAVETGTLLGGVITALDVGAIGLLLFLTMNLSDSISQQITAVQQERQSVEQSY